MNNILEQRLTESLGRRADSLGTVAGGEPLRLDDVRSRATRIRRRRHAVSAAGIAAVLALVVPIGVMGVNGWDRAETPPVAELVPTPIEEPIVLAPGAEEGAAPDLAWISGRQVHLPDGTTLETDRDYMGVHLVAGRVLALWNDNDTGFKTLDELGDGGEVLSSVPVGDQVEVTEDQSAAVWQTREGQVRVLDDAGVRETGIELPAVQLSALTGGDGCARGCTLWYQGPGEEAPGRVDLDTGRRQPVAGLMTVSDVHQDGRVTGMTSYDELEPGSCSAVVLDGEQQWETCDHTLEQFSQDGAWVSATDEYLDGAGQGQLVVLDARTGERLLEFDAGAGWFTQRVWEDETHLLAAHYFEDERTWQVFRLGLDGSVELAVPSRPGTMDDGLGMILSE